MKTAYIPELINIEEHIKNNPPRFKYHLDNFYYIIGVIVRQSAMYKTNIDAEYVPINAQIMQSKVRDYKVYVEYLITQKIIETDNQYIPGSKSRGFRIADYYYRSKIRIVTITKRSLVSKSWAQILKERDFEKNYGHLTKWFNSNLQIDFKGASQSLVNLFYTERKLRIPNARKRARNRALNLKMFSNQEFFHSVDDTSKRFHSNLTNLKSELRQFITYGGEQLCSIDVKNSQPFISTVLLNKEFYQKDKKGLNLFSLSKPIYYSLLTSIPTILTLLHPDNIIMLVKEDETQCGSDIGRYCSIVNNGSFYRYISAQYSEVMGLSLNVEIPEEKRRLKDIVFCAMYSSNRFIWQEDALEKKFFKHLFPTVYEIFALVKQRDNNHFLPIILQLIESDIIINRVTKTIAKSHPKLPLFTIHDSIVTLESHKEIVHSALKDEFERQLGLKPSLSIETWNAPNNN